MSSIQFRPVVRTILFKSLPFSNIFHNFESCKRPDPMYNQVVHDVITGRNSFFQIDCPIFDQVLRIIQPHISPMRKAGNTYQFGKILRPRILKHAPDKRCTVFRKPQSTYSHTFISNSTGQLLRSKA